MAKSKRLDPKELITALVNKQLEPYNKTLEDVKQEKDWYEIYTCTPNLIVTGKQIGRAHV